MINISEQMAVITKRALFTQKMEIASRTNNIVADHDSGWRIQAGDEDEKCFDRLESLELISLAELCKLEPAFSHIMEQPEEQTYCMVNGRFEPDTLPTYVSE